MKPFYSEISFQPVEGGPTYALRLTEYPTVQISSDESGGAVTLPADVLKDMVEHMEALYDAPEPYAVEIQ